MGRKIGVLLALLLTASFATGGLVRANFLPGMTPLPELPVITIASDGSINPANASISKIEGAYTLTANLDNIALEIQSDSIILDGAGFAIQLISTEKYAPRAGITVNSSQVTIRNVKVSGHPTEILVLGYYNKIIQNQIGPVNRYFGIEIKGNYNYIAQNAIHDMTGSAIHLEGNHNNIIGNRIGRQGISMSDSGFNAFIGNTIEQCTYFAVKPSNENNLFYLNNFINNTNGPSSLVSPEERANLNLPVLAQTHIAPLKWESIPKGWIAIYPNNTHFDYNSNGNYWSDYTGTDINGDGIGDTPYIIGGNLRDRYPLMAPFDSSNLSLEFPAPDWASLTPQESPSTPAPPASPSASSIPQKTSPASLQENTSMLGVVALGSAVTVGAVLLVYLKKHDRKL